jgi:hypothetical protein
MVRDASRDALPNPKCRVSREPESAVNVELLDGMEQTNIPFLDEILPAQRSASIPLGNADD